MQAELYLDTQCDLAEGPVWFRNEFYFVDINPGHLHRHNPETGETRIYELGQKVGCMVPRSNGHAVVALANGFHFLNLETGALESIVDPEAELSDNRFNDGKCDPQGRLWAGTLNMKGQRDACALYRLESNGSAEKVVAPVSLSNGLAWTADSRTFYYIDTHSGKVVAYDFDPESGSLSNQRTVISVPQFLGYPDGMTIDANGNLWVALWGGWSVVCWNPNTGEQLAKIDVPAAQTSCPVFGGKNLDTLYITTARAGISAEDLEKQPHAGSIFICKPGVQGAPVHPFAG